MISTSTTCLRSFFGLGPAELAIVALASIIVIGPSKLLNFSKEAGNIAGKTAAGMGEEWSEELKNIPEEFRKGIELGEIEARSRKAKVMADIEKEDDNKVVKE
jgi:Sec-independent protein translocase protein TatA